MTLSHMHLCKTYMYINFQQNGVSRSVKTVHTNLFAEIANLRLQLEFRKSRLSDMHPTDIQADFDFVVILYACLLNFNMIIK